jgi:hypothetical protein
MLYLPGHTVAAFFQPALQGILDTVTQKRIASPRPISLIILLGGFFKNEWLHQAVKDTLGYCGLNVYRPDLGCMKPLASGAAYYLVERLICPTPRMTRLSYCARLRRPARSVLWARFAWLISKVLIPLQIFYYVHITETSLNFTGHT